MFETSFSSFEKKDAIQRQTLFANLETPFGLWEISVMKSGISREAWPAPTEMFTVQNTDTSGRGKEHNSGQGIPV